MTPVLHPGDLVMVVRATTSSVGDVVVAREPRKPERPTLKRVAAVAGDVADLPGGPARVPSGHVALVGDNRTHSTDSRHYGPVPAGLIEARAVMRLWPPMWL